MLEKLGDDATIFVKNENKLNRMLPGNQILKSLALRAKVELDDNSVSGHGENVKSLTLGDEIRRQIMGEENEATAPLRNVEKQCRRERITAQGADGNVVYNIGEIRKRDISTVPGSSARRGAQDGNVSAGSVADHAPPVKGQYSLTPETKADNHPLKEAQLRVIQQSNPADDTYHTWIRDVEDIHTLDEVLEDPEWDYDEFDPDYTRAMAEDAIQTGEIRVYSSYPITEGVLSRRLKWKRKAIPQMVEKFSMTSGQ